MKSKFSPAPLLCLAGMAQGQKGTRFKEISPSGRFRPENIQSNPTQMENTLHK